MLYNVFTLQAIVARESCRKVMQVAPQRIQRQMWDLISGPRLYQINKNAVTHKNTGQSSRSISGGLKRQVFTEASMTVRVFSLHAAIHLPKRYSAKSPPLQYSMTRKTWLCVSCERRTRGRHESSRAWGKKRAERSTLEIRFNRLNER